METCWGFHWGILLESPEGPVVRGAECGAEWRGAATLWGELAPLWPSSSVHVLLAEVSEFCDASLQGASLCLRTALLSSSLGSATCPVTLGSFLHEIFHQLDSSISFLHEIFHQLDSSSSSL